MRVNPGELNKKIKIVSIPSGTDDEGFQTNSETIVRECWSKVTNTSGTEIIKSNADFAEVNTRFLVRYSSKPIDEKMTIVFNGQYYDIVYINNYNFSNEYVEIYAKVKK